MKAVEFCYWLQGYFEIAQDDNSSATPLVAHQVACIGRHLDLVKKVEPNHGNKFVSTLDLLLRHARELSATDVFQVQIMLGEQFKHVIDPSYGGDQKALGKIHGSDAASGEVARC